jgi:hypothetical protein
MPKSNTVFQRIFGKGLKIAALKEVYCQALVVHA